MNPILRLTTIATRLAAAVSRRKALVQGIAGAVALALGFWGWTIEEPPLDAVGWLNNLFRTLQLITLQFPKSLESDIPWQLHVARLLVPAVAVLATFNVLVAAITRPVRMALMPHASGHIVVCGTEQLTEAALKILAARGRQIVMLAADIPPGRRESLEGLGLTIVEADPRQPAAFDAVNLKHASAVFLAQGDDMANLDLAMLVIEHATTRPTGKAPLALAVLIEREDLARELDANLDSLARSRNVRYHRICPDRDGLRQDLGRLAPALLKTGQDQRSHVLMIGLVGNWQQVLLQLIVSAQDQPDQTPLFTLVLDEPQHRAFAAWRAERADLPLVSEFIAVERGAGLLPAEADLAAWRAQVPPPQLAVILHPDAEAVTTALALMRPDNPFGLIDQPILVRRTSEDRLLGRLIGRHPAGPRQHVRPFGGLVRAEAIERILDRKGDDAAIALHASYLDKANTRGDTPTPAVVAWDELSENLRDANRAAAEHRPILVAAAGGEEAAAAVAADISSEGMERLARIEHRRWMADRIDRGWRSGPVRDDGRRISPSLVPYDALSPTDQHKDRESVRAVLSLPKA